MQCAPLSELQKTILRLAFANLSNGRAAVSYAEVFREYWGWEATGKRSSGAYGESPKTSQAREYGSALFSKQLVGVKAYAAAMAALSRACVRLQERGLVVRRTNATGHGKELVLTDEGMIISEAVHNAAVQGPIVPIDIRRIQVPKRIAEFLRPSAAAHATATFVVSESITEVLRPVFERLFIAHADVAPNNAAKFYHDLNEAIGGVLLKHRPAVVTLERRDQAISATKHTSRNRR